MKLKTLSMIILVLGFAGCGGDDPLPGEEPLPEQPQLQGTGEISIFFDPAAVNGSVQTADYGFYNAGRNDLVFSSLGIVEDGGGVFSASVPGLTAESKQSVGARITFTPPTTGTESAVHYGTLVGDSNAENQPHVVIEIFAVTIPSPREADPDIKFFQSSVPTDPQQNWAIVRFANLGGEDFNVTGYELSGNTTAFSFPSGTFTAPTPDVPFISIPAATLREHYVGLTLLYNPGAGDATAATVTVRGTVADEATEHTFDVEVTAP